MADQLLVYGASNSHKTTMCGQFHDFMARRTGIPGVHITLDSTVAPMQDQIDMGMVRIWHLGYETAHINSSIIAALNAAAAGFVPTHLSPEGARMSGEYQPLQGAMSIEGLWMISDAMKHYFMNERGMVAGGYTETDGSQMGSAQMQLYDMIKNKLFGTVTRMKSLRIPAVLWSSHEGRGTDMMQAAVLGPAMLPLKGLDKVPGYFAHVLRAESVTIQNAAGQPEGAKLIYFEPHQDKASGMTWPCKTSLTPMRNFQLRQKALEMSGNVLHNALLSRIDQGQLIGGLPEFLKFLYPVPVAPPMLPVAPHGQPQR